MITNADNFSAAMIGLIEAKLEAKCAEAIELVDEMADELADELQKASEKIRDPENPKKITGKSYARGWVVDGFSGDKIVKNENKPKLTHLLEKGSYMTENRQTAGKGKKYYVPANRGKMPAQQHIFTTFEKVKTKYTKKFHKL